MSTNGLIRAAGGVVLRQPGGRCEVVLVHRPRYDDWAFPKGKLLDGEAEEAAALREVLEETGLRCRLGKVIGVVTYTDALDRPKTVRYWTMRLVNGAFTPSGEVDQLRWVDVAEADELLTYPHDRDLLRAAIGPEALGPLYVLRHAKARSREGWPGPDKKRPLTRPGRRQAARLVERLADLDVECILSSPFVRCVQSVAPLARERGLEIEVAPVLAEGREIAQVAAFLESLDDRATVVCGHGPEIQGLITRLRRRGAEVDGPRSTAKGAMWVLDRAGDRITAARYLADPRG